jgi:hypothetical protein
MTPRVIELQNFDARPRRARGLWLYLVLGLSLLVSLDQAVVFASDMVYTGRHALKIPFDFEEAQVRAVKATEVQLLVSFDRGRTWKTAAKAKPQDRVFRYNAADNGEYWFSVRLVNVLKENVQPGAPQVGLKVFVDDTAPTLDLKIRELSAGRVELTWRADDDALDTETLEIMYREGEDADWQAVDHENQPTGRLDLNIESAGTVYAAARVSDLAKNSVTADSQATVSKATTNKRESREPDFSKPVAVAPFPSAAEKERRPSTLALPTSQFTPKPTLPVTVQSTETPPPSLVPESFPPTLPHVLPAPAAQPRPLNVSHSQPAPVAVRAATPNRVSPYPQGAKLVNSMSFNIGYSLDQIGPSGVGSVKLYITEDNGRMWYEYGTDPDRTSPFQVRVEKSGQFGFAIRATSGIGLSENPPQPGQVPEIVVIVDKVVPQPKFGLAQQGQGLAHNQIQFSWVLTDSDLAEAPVMLLRSESPSGPWEPISGWIENTGRYQWTVNQSIDRPVYVRLEARDLAGNIGRADLEQPLQIDLVKPTARIIDIETVTQ